jgi:hypothetical protein
VAAEWPQRAMAQMEHVAGSGRAGPATGDSGAGVGGPSWLQRLADQEAAPAPEEPEQWPEPAGERNEAAESGEAPSAGERNEAAESGEAPSTGEPRVDAALRLLDRLPGLPVSDHPELFEQVHARLSEVLGELESGSAGPAGS